MKIEDQLKLIKRNTEEILTEEDLLNLLSSGKQLNHYIGFEISGLVHLGTGLMCMGKVADFLKAGFNVKVFLADWHSFINDKLGGHWEIIKKLANGYFKEALIASLKCFDAPVDKVEFILGSDLYQEQTEWENLMEISKQVTLSRVKRSITILGRRAGDSIDFAKLIYPPLQAADIFTLGVNIAHAGIDQRSAHIIARQAAPKLKIHPSPTPVAIHHPLILGLQKPPVWPIPKDNQEMKINLKMSKSKPDSAIFVHDSPDEIQKKILAAFCPPGEVEFNPIINWVKHLVFWGEETGKFEVKRNKDFGGDKIFTSFKELSDDYQNGNLHPLDLKQAMASWLIEKLTPARNHFTPPKLQKMKEEMRSITS